MDTNWSKMHMPGNTQSVCSERIINYSLHSLSGTLSVTLTFDFLTSKSHQFISVPN